MAHPRRAGAGCNTGMLRRMLLVLAIVGAAPLAQAGRGVMPVSVTVVNTCFFGVQARCHLPEAGLRVQPEVVPITRDGAWRRRVVHF